MTAGSPLVSPPDRVVTATGEAIPAICRRFLVPGTRPIEIIAPCETTPDPDDVLTQSIVDGSFAFPEHYALLLALAPHGSRVLDLGGHLGTFTLFAAAHGYEVLTIEACPRNAAFLRASIAHNRLTRVTLAPVAVGDRNTTVEFVQSGSWGHVGSGPGAIKVPAFTAEAILSDHKWDRVDFVKMDIEGSEVATLEGLAPILVRDAPPVLYESNGGSLRAAGYTPLDLRDRFSRVGYCSFIVRDHALVALGAADLQLQCVVDCVALKKPAPAPDTWPVTMETTWTRRFFVQRECESPYPWYREYTGGALQHAVPELLKDWRLAAALNRLKRDSVPEVREAVAWWRHDHAVLLRAVGHYVRAGVRRLLGLRRYAKPGHSIHTEQEFD